jgi:O-antigen/teichoic acid export membrane protein
MRSDDALSSRLARNALWSLAGTVLPLPVALLVVRPLLDGLGAERFGILALAWAMMAYFALCDLGLGRATTRQVAEARASGNHAALGPIFWSALTAHALLGLVAGAALAAAAPQLAAHALSSSPALIGEARHALLLLAVSIPFVIVTIAFRGLLEGLERFDVLAAVNLPQATLIYLMPLAALAVAPTLPVVIGGILVARGAALALFAVCAWRVCPEIRRPHRPTRAVAGPLFTLGGWLAISAAVVPAMSTADRLIIAVVISAAAVSFYAIPYDIVTRLWLLTGALLGVLFPAFSGLTASRRAEARLLLERGAGVLLIVLAPSGAIIITAAPAAFEWWLGPEFRVRSAPIAQALAVGMLFSGFANLATTFLQANGRAPLVARLEVAQALAYAGVLWWAAARYGPAGIAIAWTTRASVQMCVALSACALSPDTASLMPSVSFWARRVVGALVLFAVSWRLSAIPMVWLQVVALAMTLAVFGVWVWLFVIDRETRGAIARWRGLMTVGSRR